MEITIETLTERVEVLEQLALHMGAKLALLGENNKLSGSEKKLEKSNNVKGKTSHHQDPKKKLYKWIHSFFKDKSS